MLLPQHHQIALEVQRIEGTISPGLPKEPRRWRWLVGKRYRVEDELTGAGTGMPLYDPYG